MFNHIINKSLYFNDRYLSEFIICSLFTEEYVKPYIMIWSDMDM